MEAGIEFSAADVRKLMTDYQRLGEAVRSKLARQAVNAGATPVLRTARQEVPVLEGTLKRSLGRKTRGYRSSASAVAVIGARISGKNRGYHAHLVHDGHIAADGTFVPGKPYQKIAQEKAGAEAIGRMHAKLAEGIRAEANR